MAVLLIEPHPTQESLVKALGELLEEAKSGKLQSLLAIALYADHTSYGILSGRDDFARLVGALEMAKHDLIAEAGDA